MPPPQPTGPCSTVPLSSPRPRLADRGRTSSRRRAEADLVYVATDQTLQVPVGRRHRVVVAPIAHERKRADASRLFIARVVGCRQRRLEGGKVMLQPVTDRAIMAAQPVCQTLSATVQKMRVQGLEVSEHGNRHKEVSPRVTDEPLDLPLVVALASAAKPVRDQAVGLQLAEHARPLTLAIAENAADRDLAVVVEDRLPPSGEKGDSSHGPTAD